MFAATMRRKAANVSNFSFHPAQNLLPIADGVLAFSIKGVEKRQKIIAFGKEIGESLALCTDNSGMTFRDGEIPFLVGSVYEITLITIGQTDFDCF